MIRSAVKKSHRLIGFTFLLLSYGCGQTAPNRAAVNEPQNQAVVKKIEPVEKVERDAKLQAEADALLPLFDDMPPVPFYPSGEPVLKAGTNAEKAVAYTRCENHKFPSVFVKKIFYQKANRKQLVNILKHELTHAWLCRQEIPWGHDARFRRKFQQVGGFGN